MASGGWRGPGLAWPWPGTRGQGQGEVAFRAERGAGQTLSERPGLPVGAQRGLSTRRPSAWRPVVPRPCPLQPSPSRPPKPCSPHSNRRPVSTLLGLQSCLLPEQLLGWLEGWSGVTESRCHFNPRVRAGEGTKTLRTWGTEGPGPGAPLPLGQGHPAPPGEAGPRSATWSHGHLRGASPPRTRVFSQCLGQGGGTQSGSAGASGTRFPCRKAVAMAGLNRREEKRHRPPGACPRAPRLHGLLSRVLGASGPPQGGGAGPGS